MTSAAAAIRWNAMEYRDEGRLGSIGCFGLPSREAAIAWLHLGQPTPLYLRPSWHVWQKENAAP